MDRISVARVGKTHGVKGYVRLKSFNDEYEHLYAMREAVIVPKSGKEQPVQIEDMKPLGDQVLVKFVGYDTPESARTFSGCELWAASEHAAPLAEGEFYIADLVGCCLYFGEEQRGEVVGVAEIGHTDLLEIKSGSSAHQYLPMKDEYVGRIDPVTKRIELRVSWILE